MCCDRTDSVQKRGNEPEILVSTTPGYAIGHVNEIWIPTLFCKVHADATLGMETSGEVLYDCDYNGTSLLRRRSCSETTLVHSRKSVTILQLVASAWWGEQVLRGDTDEMFRRGASSNSIAATRQ